MILVDTSVWVDHFRRGDQPLADLLSNGRVWMHPFVRGELALGNLKPRAEILQLLSDLPQATVADESELLHVNLRAIRASDLRPNEASLM